MILQNTFYVLGIISFVLFIVFLITIIILLFYIKTRIALIQKLIEEKFEQARTIVSHPREIAMSVGAVALEKLLNNASNFIERKMSPKKKKPEEE